MLLDMSKFNIKACKSQAQQDIAVATLLEDSVEYK